MRFAVLGSAVAAVMMTGCGPGAAFQGTWTGELTARAELVADIPFELPAVTEATVEVGALVDGCNDVSCFHDGVITLTGVLEGAETPLNLRTAVEGLHVDTDPSASRHEHYSSLELSMGESGLTSIFVSFSSEEPIEGREVWFNVWSGTLVRSE
jgi:hypothetical protein